MARGRGVGGRLRRPAARPLVASRPPRSTSACAVHGCTPDRAPARQRSARVPHHRRARHAPDRDGHRRHATHGATGVCFCPTTERDLGDGIGPAPALLDGAGPFSLGSDSHAMIDLFEEARAVELDERLARRERGIISAARAAGRRDRRRPTRPGLVGRGRARGSARAPTSSRSTSVDSYRGWRSHGGERRVRRIGRRRHRRGGRRAYRRRPSGDIVARADVGERSGRGDRRAVGGPMTVLYDNIGELVTNDPAQGDGSPLGLVTDAAMVVDGDRIAWVGPTGRAPAADQRVDCAERERDPRIRRQPCASGLRRRPVRRVRRADERRRPTTAAASRPRLRPPAPPRTTRSPANVDRLADELLAQRRHHFRDQERLRADGRRRSAVAGDRRCAAHRRDDVPRRARRSRRVPRRPRRLRRPGRRRHAHGLRAARPLDRRVLRSRRVRRRRGARHPAGGHRRRARRRACTPPSSAASAGIQLAVELGAASVDHCTYATDADVEALAGRATPSPRCCRAPNSPRAHRGPTADGSSTRASPSRWPPTATPAVRTPRACRSASRSRCAT